MPQNARNIASKKALQKTKGKGGRHQEVLPWWQSTWLLGGVVVVVIAVVFVFVVAQKTQQPQESGIGSKPVPAGVQAIILHPDPKVLNAVGLGSIKPSQAQIYKVPASAHEPFLKSNGKPEFFYLGAEYCPYCAAERWSFIIALSRFGTFSNLHLMESSSTDVYANTHTFTFYGSTYSSNYVSFVPVEGEDRNQNPLQTPTASQSALVQKLDYSPYVPTVQGSSGGAIPFFSIANQYIGSGSGYLPSVLSGLNWQQIANQLKDPHSTVAQAVLGNANYLTAAICKVTHGAPSNVCDSSMITSIQKQLPK